MNQQLQFALALPEIVLAVMVSVILLGDAFVQSKDRVLSYRLALLTLVGLTALTAVMWSMGIAGTTFYSGLKVSGFTHLFKIFSYIAVFVTLVYNRQYFIDRQMVGGGEPYTLVMLALLGQMVMISAANFLTVYLGIELMSLALYALIAVRRDSGVATESAMKYFVLGSLASGFLLFGISLVYGGTGSISLAVVGDMIQGHLTGLHILAGVGMVFIVAGIAFKLGAAPFHMWVPDVYQGAPTGITLVLGASPKIAGLAILLRILKEAFAGIQPEWSLLFEVLAILSLFVGNFVAIMQTNLKRMLAYSTISHVGFICLSIFVADFGAALYYITNYVLTTLASFGLVLLMARQGIEADAIDDFKGLNKRNPLLAFAMLLVMFSLAGIPPLMGFYAKFAVLMGVVAQHHVALAVYGVMMSLVGAFYYLRVVKVMYFDEPTEGFEAPVTVGHAEGWVMGLNVGLLVLLGVFPSLLMNLCLNALN